LFGDDVVEVDSVERESGEWRRRGQGEYDNVEFDDDDDVWAEEDPAHCAKETTQVEPGENYDF